VVLLPGLVDSHGKFAGFGAAIVLASLGSAGQVAADDFNRDGATDLAVTSQGGVLLVFGTPQGAVQAGVTIASNKTPGTARNLGDAEHLLSLPQSIVTGHEDAYYTYTVPHESSGSGAEVIDFLAQFQFAGGVGLGLTVTDLTTGQVLGTGTQPGTLATSQVRFRVTAGQGDKLLVHVAGLAGGPSTTAGFAAYTLDVDVLPQVSSIQAEAAVPGGPVTSLVLTLQGDRLDPATAENPANYTVTWFGPDGVQGTADDQVIPVGSVDGGLPVIYNPNSALDVTSGLDYPTAVRQTITLLFPSALPAGSYEIKLSPNLQTAAYNTAEAGLLNPTSSFQAHPVVSAGGGVIKNGSSLVVPNLVLPPGTPANLGAIQNGTPFLTQLTGDLGALLDELLLQHGDNPVETAAINNEILARFGPAIAAAAGSQTSFTIFWFDPVSFDLQSPQGQRASYNLGTNQASSTAGPTFVSVGSNVEVVVMANQAGTFKLDVGNVPELARGGALLVSDAATLVLSLTDAFRSGTTSLSLALGDTVNVGPGTGPGPGPGPSPGPQVPGSVTPATAESTGTSVAANSETPGGRSSVFEAFAQSLVLTLLVGPQGFIGEGQLTGQSTNGVDGGAVGAAAAFSAAPGGSEESMAAGMGQLRNAVDQLLGLPGGSQSAGVEWKLSASKTLSMLGRAAFPLKLPGDLLGVQDMLGADLPWQDMLDVLVRSGGSTAAAVMKQIRSGVRNGQTPNKPAAPARTDTPAPATGGGLPPDTGLFEGSDLEGLLWEAGCDDALAQEDGAQASDAVWAALFVAAGAANPAPRERAADDKTHRQALDKLWLAGPPA
jgi:hypothetical protein